MSRNIVMCCDGTANEFAQDNTNVVKLYSALQHDPMVQKTWYHPGVGTMEPAGALTPLARRVTKILGLAFGYGLFNDVRDAYVYLINHYEPGDCIFLFGFSRGAYTVRAVAALIHLYGILRPGQDSLVPYVIRMMLAMRRGERRDSATAPELDKYFELARAFKRSMAHRLDPAVRPIRFVGVWDTVSSVGWISNPLRLPYVTNNPSIEIGRHAVAIDERRAFFRNHLWRPPEDESLPQGPIDLRQVWFSGVHCDVGGGYPEAESGLSKIPLRWMLDEAEKAGLLVDVAARSRILGEGKGTDGGTYARPDPNGVAHESLRGWWNIAEFVPKPHFDWATRTEGRRMNLFRCRTVPPGSLVHASAFARQGRCTKHLPPDVVKVED